MYSLIVQQYFEIVDQDSIRGVASYGALVYVPPQVFGKVNGTYCSVDFLRNPMQVYNSALKLQILKHSTAVVTNCETIISIIELD